jgi:SnoaL-like domain
MTCEVIDPRGLLAENRRTPGSDRTLEARRLSMNTTGNGQVVELVDRYIAVWNETDAAARRKLIARTYTEDADYLDPVLQGQGRDGIDALVKAVHEKYPGYKFSRTSDVDCHHDRARFSWQLAPENGLALVKGIDFAMLSADGHLQAVTGFFTEVATPAQ